jgi:hypothetical protein
MCNAKKLKVVIWLGVPLSSHQEKFHNSNFVETVGFNFTFLEYSSRSVCCSISESKNKAYKDSYRYVIFV